MLWVGALFIPKWKKLQIKTPLSLPGQLDAPIACGCCCHLAGGLSALAGFTQSLSGDEQSLHLRCLQFASARGDQRGTFLKENVLSPMPNQPN